MLRKEPLRWTRAPTTATTHSTTPLWERISTTQLPTLRFRPVSSSRRATGESSASRTTATPRYDSHLCNLLYCHLSQLRVLLNWLNLRQRSTSSRCRLTRRTGTTTGPISNPTLCQQPHSPHLTHHTAASLSAPARIASRKRWSRPMRPRLLGAASKRLSTAANALRQRGRLWMGRRVMLTWTPRSAQHRFPKTAQW